MKKFWVESTGIDELYLYKYKTDIIKSIPDFSIDSNPTGRNFGENAFEKLTGLKLNPGEIVQCELKIIKREKEK